MSRFDNFIGEKCIEINGTKLPIAITMQERLKITKFFANKNDPTAYTDAYPIVFEIFKKSYPDEKPEIVEEFLLQNYETIIFELMIFLKMTTREKVNSYKEKLLSIEDDEKKK